ncbi:MAG: polysaccharide deacetylase family protein [Clostridia bacterium]|nr:polysaccharide deacetylase family protein [Clostridia bacterium]
MIYQKRPAFRAVVFLLLLSAIFSLGGCYTEKERPAYLPIPGEETSTEETVTEEPKPTKRVALTYDDGPNHYDDRTKKIVDELDKYGYHATFFVVGNRIAGGDSVSYAVEKGNEIGIHGYTHTVYYDECTEDDFRYELNMTEQAIQKQVPGYQVNLMRPVGGKITGHRVETCPYSVILWSVDSEDWDTANRYYTGISDEEADARINNIVENIMSSLSDGDIILMHDIYESTYDATKILLARLYAEGYDVVTVSELFGDGLAKGKIYYSADT